MVGVGDPEISGNDYAVEAELLAMAVAPDLRRCGLGLDFGTRSFRALSRRCTDESRVVADQANRVDYGHLPLDGVHRSRTGRSAPGRRVGGIGVMGVCVAFLIALSWSMLMILLGVHLGILNHPKLTRWQKS